MHVRHALEFLEQNRENNFLASVYMDQQIHGIAFLDISTGEFLTSQGDQTFIDKLLTSFKPKEVLVQRSHRDQFQEGFGESFNTFLLEEWVYTEENARDKLQHQLLTIMFLSMKYDYIFCVFLTFLK